MNTLYKLQKQAIMAAKQLDWDKAIETNSQILSLDELNIQALNRLGAAYLQKKQPKKAKKQFKKVLQIDKTNSIAKKNLTKIKNNIKPNITAFSNKFIDEPGKSQSIELCRLTNKKVLQEVGIGQSCTLIIKNRFISVKINDRYIGALPEDISFRLSKLIKTGNEYKTTIKTCNEKECSVHIAEDKVAKKNKNIPSFSIKSNN